MNEDQEHNQAPAAVAGNRDFKISVPRLDLGVERYSAFKSWKSKWQDYVMLTNLGAKDAAYQAAMLRYAFSDDTRQIYESLKLSDEDNKNPDRVLEEMEKFAKGIINETLERHTFYSRRQQDGETFDDFLTDVILLSKNCNFCNGCISGMIRDRIVGGVSDNELRRRLLSEKDLTEEKATEMCRSQEKALQGAATLTKQANRSTAAEIDGIDSGGVQNRTRNDDRSNSVPPPAGGGRGRPPYRSNRGGYRMQSTGGGRGGSNYSRRNDGGGSSGSISCKFCARSHQPGRNNCPAYGQLCRSCRSQNHFAESSLCKNNRSSNVNHVQDDEEEEQFNMSALYIGAVTADAKGEEPVPREDSLAANQPRNKQTKSEVAEREEIQEVSQVESEGGVVEKSCDLDVTTPKGKVSFKIDSGADVTCIGDEHLDQFGLTVDDLKPTQKRLNGADNKRIKCIGYFRTNINTDKNVKVSTLIYVCKGVRKALLGKYACIKLGLIKITIPEKVYVNSVKKEDQAKVEQNEVITQFPQVFAGLGFFGDDVHIELKESGAAYHVNAPRRVSLPLMEPLRRELNRMEKMGVIRKVDEPTDWCHPIVVIPKPKCTERLRVCIDLTKLNEQVKREFYELPSVPETLSKLGNKCKVMSKLDFNSGYWQMPLDKRSQLMCTFTTPYGRYCPTRAPFGLCSLPEIFTKKLDKLLSGLEGIVRSMDDILVHGETVEEHDERLLKLLQVLKDNGITLNLDKCIFRKSKLEFLGHVSVDGIQPNH